MIEPLDRSRRDSTPFQFTTRQLRGLIDSNHLLIRIDKQLNFAKLGGPLEDPYCPDFAGPPFILRQRVRAGDGASIATMRLATSAITKAHEWAGHESPCRDQGVRASLKGW